MNIVVSVIVSALMIAGAAFYTEKNDAPALGASQTISSLSSHATPIDADSLPIVDSALSTTKRLTWANLKATTKTYFDTLYADILTDSASLASQLSDETGTSGGFVRAGSPSITSPTLTTPLLNITGTEAKGNMLFFTDVSGNLGQLPVPPGAGYFLTGSSSMDRPAWTNAVVSFPYTASSTFTNTVTISGTTTFEGPQVGSTYFQQFNVSGTWSRPSNYSSTSVTFVECWGGGGGGSTGSSANGGGGGGGAYLAKTFKTSLLGATETVTIPTAAAAEAVGGNVTFGSWMTAYGGGAGSPNGSGGGGGGGGLAAGSAGSAGTGGAGGAPGGSAASTDNAGFGGGGGGTSNSGGRSAYGGGGGGGENIGGAAIYGGGGGGGVIGPSTGQAGGASVFGGAGGAGGTTGTAGTAPGGGGGAGGNGTGGSGAVGRCNVTTYN